MGAERQLASWHHEGRKAALNELGQIIAYRRAKAALPELKETLLLAEQAVKDAEADLKGKQAVLPKLEKTLAAVKAEMAQIEMRRQKDRDLMRPPMLQGGLYPDDAPVHGPTIPGYSLRLTPAERKAMSTIKTRSRRAVELGIEGAERNVSRAKAMIDSAEKRLAQVRKWTGTIRRKVTHFEGLERPETPFWGLFLQRESGQRPEG